jgi:hypothetical protein
MSTAVWITIGVSVASLIVGTIVTLIVAALHRKQMRQIALHRADPSVPLVPPPHPITRFFKNRLFMLLNIFFNGFFIVMNAYFLVREVNKTGPNNS